MHRKVEGYVDQCGELIEIMTAASGEEIEERVTTIQHSRLQHAHSAIDAVLRTGAFILSPLPIEWLL